MSNADIVVKRADDNPWYVTIHCEDENGHKITSTYRNHKDECAQDAINDASAEAEDEGYTVNALPAGYQHGE